MTLGELFPGRMGRVVLTRVAIRVRRPDLLKMPPSTALEADLVALLEDAKTHVQKG